MQMWRNWQTRYFEVVVRFLVWVQVPSSAPYADMAELADALDSGSSDFTVIQVQVLLSAPNQYNPNQFFPVGDGFGLFVYFERYENTYFPNGVIKRPESKPRGSRKKRQTSKKQARQSPNRRIALPVSIFSQRLVLQFLYLAFLPVALSILQIPAALPHSHRSQEYRGKCTAL